MMKTKVYSSRCNDDHSLTLNRILSAIRNFIGCPCSPRSMRADLRSTMSDMLQLLYVAQTKSFNVTIVKGEGHNRCIVITRRPLK